MCWNQHGSEVNAGLDMAVRHLDAGCHKRACVWKNEWSVPRLIFMHLNDGDTILETRVLCD